MNERRGIVGHFNDTFSNGGTPAWFYMSVVTVLFYGLFTNTALLTHGLGVVILMAWVSYGRVADKD